MGTVRVERCPDCGARVGDGTLYEHKQREHRKGQAMTLDQITSRLRHDLYFTEAQAQSVAPLVAALLEEREKEHAAEIIELVRQVAAERKRAEQAEAETQALREALWTDNGRHAATPDELTLLESVKSALDARHKAEAETQALREALDNLRTRLLQAREPLWAEDVLRITERLAASSSPSTGSTK